MLTVRAGISKLFFLFTKEYCVVILNTCSLILKGEDDEYDEENDPDYRPEVNTFFHIVF